jgi:hypothetical protein
MQRQASIQAVKRRVCTPDPMSAVWRISGMSVYSSAGKDGACKVAAQPVGKITSPVV